MLGAELIQFSHCDALGAGQWRLSGLLRGRGGTESAIGIHTPGEAFVLLDEKPVALDATRIGNAPAVRIAALGLADTAAVESGIACRGIGLRPLSPVHPDRAATPDGGIALRWCRRARGAWLWTDYVDAPLQEQSESYLVSFVGAGAVIASWATTSASLIIAAADIASLRTTAPAGRFLVRQQGTFALSDPLDLGPLP